MQFIRSLIFNIFLYLGIICVLILAVPTLFLPAKFALYCGKFLAYYIIFILKVFLNTNVIFHGLEHLKKVEKFFVASAHQSMFETFAFQAPLDYPIFILKKELLRIPLFGWYLKKIGSIEIVRETTTKDNLSFFDKIKKTIYKNNRPLLIFPQGTRVKFNEIVPFKKGVGRIYDALGLHCIPVALNSGKIWPKNSFFKHPGDIHITFLEPIKPGIEKNTFIKILEEKIYSEIKKYP
ncbi:MAG: 1-acyl-sn-glycerol-3-phosphate acyltransferase [Pelagibacteraceae bacterium]|jgi:1-acyl-sn-glycerol-3-phosphate acyltransferase|nr:1-acyl-sn-glycerol-3-phosphate acyltransferase [Pelagibacteraceae bacterium]